MEVTIRLYRIHDLDLITLYKNKSFSLEYAMRRALICHVRREGLLISPPVPSLIEVKYPKVIQFHIYLDEEKEKDVIEWLSEVKDGVRNGMIKNIFRGSLLTTCTYGYQMISNYSESHLEKIKKYHSEEILSFEKNTLKNTNVLIEIPKRKTRRKPRSPYEDLTGDEIADVALGKSTLEEIKDRKKLSPTRDEAIEKEVVKEKIIKLPPKENKSDNIESDNDFFDAMESLMETL